MNFQTRKIILIDDTRKALAVAAIQNAPTGIEVVLREPVKARSCEQNSLYWVLLGQIATQAWFNKKQFDSDTLHHYCGKKIMPETVTLKTGEQRSKWIECPDGTLRIISTTLLDKKCFSEYTSLVEAFGAELGVMFSAQ